MRVCGCEGVWVRGYEDVLARGGMGWVSVWVLGCVGMRV